MEIVFGIRPKLKTDEPQAVPSGKSRKNTPRSTMCGLNLTTRPVTLSTNGASQTPLSAGGDRNGRVSINPGSGGSGSGNGNNQWIIGPWIKPPKPWIKDSLIVKPIDPLPFEPALRDSTIITVKPKKTR